MDAPRSVVIAWLDGQRRYSLMRLQRAKRF
jgi:hypothetical protein